MRTLVTCTLTVTALSHAATVRQGQGGAASTASFVVIDAPGAKETIARGINDRGDVVGRFERADAVGHGVDRQNRRYQTMDSLDRRLPPRWMRRVDRVEFARSLRNQGPALTAVVRARLEPLHGGLQQRRVLFLVDELMAPTAHSNERFRAAERIVERTRGVLGGLIVERSSYDKRRRLHAARKVGGPSCCGKRGRAPNT